LTQRWPVLAWKSAPPLDRPAVPARPARLHRVPQPRARRRGSAPVAEARRAVPLLAAQLLVVRHRHARSRALGRRTEPHGLRRGER
jgi:hypothetical protein